MDYRGRFSASNTPDEVSDHKSDRDVQSAQMSGIAGIRGALLGAALAAFSGCTSKSLESLGGMQGLVGEKITFDASMATCAVDDVDIQRGTDFEAEAGSWENIFMIAGEEGGPTIMTYSTDGGWTYRYKYSSLGGASGTFTEVTSDIDGLLGVANYGITDYDEATGKWIARSMNGAFDTKVFSGAPGAFTGLEIRPNTTGFPGLVDDQAIGLIFNTASRRYDAGVIDTGVIMYQIVDLSSFQGDPSTGIGFMSRVATLGGASEEVVYAISGMNSGATVVKNLSFPGYPMDFNPDRGTVLVQHWPLSSVPTYIIYECSLGIVSSGDTGDTGDTAPGTAVDTAVDSTHTGDTAQDTADSVDTGDSTVDTGDTAVDSTHTGDTAQDTADSADTGDSTVDTGDSVDTGDTGDTGEPCVDPASGVQNLPDETLTYCSPDGASVQVSGAADLTLVDGRIQVVFTAPGGSVTTDGAIVVSYPDSGIIVEAQGGQEMTFRAGDFGIMPPNRSATCDETTGLQPDTVDTTDATKWLVVDNPAEGFARVTSVFGDLSESARAVPLGVTTAYSDLEDCALQAVDTGDTGDTQNPDDTATVGDSGHDSSSIDSEGDTEEPEDSKDHHVASKPEDPAGCAYTAYPEFGNSGVAVSFLAAALAAAAARRQRV